MIEFIFFLTTFFNVVGALDFFIPGIKLIWSWWIILLYISAFYTHLIGYRFAETFLLTLTSGSGLSFV